MSSRKRRARDGEAATFAYPASATTARSNRSSAQGARAAQSAGAPLASPPASPAQTSLRLSEPAERLRAALAVRAQLLDRVARRKAAVESAEQVAREASAKVASVMEPRWTALHTLDHEIHELLAALISDVGRSKRERKTLARLRETLQHRGMLTVRRPEPKRRSGAGDPPPGASPWGDDFVPPGERDAHGPHGAAGRRGFFDDDVASAPRPKESQHGGLRALFRRLVEAFHPDRVQDEREKTERTEVMKEITSAYRRGDLARLLELERQSERAGLDALDASSPPGDAGELERRLVALEQSCDELREQLRELERAVRAIRRSPQSKVAREIKRAKRAGFELADLDVVRDLDQSAAQLRKARDLCASYREGTITLAQLLTSPPILDPEGDADDELLDLVTELAQQMIHEERQRAARGEPAAPDVRAERERRQRR